MDTPARHEFVAHYTRREDGRLVAAAQRRVAAPHEDAAQALARHSHLGTIMTLVAVRPATDKDTQAWL